MWRVVPLPLGLETCTILFYWVGRLMLIDDVDVDWRRFGGQDLIPTHRKIS
jgi:hypothetical protein